MADIKTRDAVKGTIKTIDKAAIASERMKSAYVGIKDKAEQGYYADENSATEYVRTTRLADPSWGCKPFRCPRCFPDSKIAVDKDPTAGAKND